MVRRSTPYRIRAQQLRFQLRDGQPPASFGDLCMMLELEIMLGRKKDFRQRLDRAITSAYNQGLQRKAPQP